MYLGAWAIRGVCMRVVSGECMHAHVCTRMCTCARTRVYVRARVCTRVRMRACTGTCVRARMCTRVRVLMQGSAPSLPVCLARDLTCSPEQRCV